MFESLTVEKGERRIAQPVLSFAIHASLIAVAMGGGPKPTGTEPSVPPGDVIHVPEYPSPRHEVKKQGLVPIPGRAVCQCDGPIPGPIVQDDLTGVTRPIPGLPVSNPIGTPGHSFPGHSFMDSGPVGFPGVYRELDLTDSPVIVHFPQPVYPPALKGAGIEGTVQVTYVVDAIGHVEPGSIIVVSTDHSLMTESVRTALMKAQFRPGKVRGTAVRSLVRQTVRFSLMSL